VDCRQLPAVFLFGLSKDGRGGMHPEREKLPEENTGIRGATVASANTPDAIYEATRTLLTTIVRENGISAEAIAYVLFTATPDLDAAYPAEAARAMGWCETPMLCTQEMRVQGSLPRCIRALVVCRLSASSPVRHVYLGEARTLRPDWACKEEQP